MALDYTADMGIIIWVRTIIYMNIMCMCITVNSLWCDVTLCACVRACVRVHAPPFCLSVCHDQRPLFCLFSLRICCWIVQDMLNWWVMVTMCMYVYMHWLLQSSFVFIPGWFLLTTQLPIMSYIIATTASSHSSLHPWHVVIFVIRVKLVL